MSTEPVTAAVYGAIADHYEDAEDAARRSEDENEMRLPAHADFVADALTPYIVAALRDDRADAVARYIHQWQALDKGHGKYTERCICNHHARAIAALTLEAWKAREVVA